MAQEDIVSGIFGLTPEIYQAGQTKRDIAEQQMAQESANASGGLFSKAYAPQIQQQAQLNARAIGGLLGVEDPQLQMVREVSSIRNQFDITTPEGMQGFAQAIAPKYPDLAMQALDKVTALELKRSQTELRKAQAAKALRGPTASPEQLLTSGKYTPSSIAKYQETSNISDLVLSKEAMGEGGKQEMVSNNGVKAGYVDAKGNFFNNQGRKVTTKEYTDAQTSHDKATDLLYKLQNVTEDDINNAYGSAADYTTLTGGKLIGPTKTLEAQTKINEIGIRNVLNNLSQLKGASSDKEMAQMIKDFPGFQASPDVMRSWSNRAINTTNTFLSRSEKRYGFDTDYAPENLFNVKTKEESKSKQTPAAPTSGWSVVTPKQ